MGLEVGALLEHMSFVRETIRNNEHMLAVAYRPGAATVPAASVPAGSRAPVAVPAAAPARVDEASRAVKRARQDAPAADRGGAAAGGGGGDGGGGSGGGGGGGGGRADAPGVGTGGGSGGARVGAVAKAAIGSGRLPWVIASKDSRARATLLVQVEDEKFDLSGAPARAAAAAAAAAALWRRHRARARHVGAGDSGAIGRLVATPDKVILDMMGAHRGGGRLRGRRLSRGRGRPPLRRRHRAVQHVHGGRRHAFVREGTAGARGRGARARSVWR